MMQRRWRLYKKYFLKDSMMDSRVSFHKSLRIISPLGEKTLSPNKYPCLDWYLNQFIILILTTSPYHIFTIKNAKQSCLILNIKSVLLTLSFSSWTLIGVLM